MTGALRGFGTLAYRAGAFVSHARWILLSVTLAAVGVLDLYVGLPRALAVALAVLSLVLVVIEVKTHADQLRRTQFVDRPDDDFADVRGALGGRFELVDCLHGHAVVDLLASRAVASGQASAHLAGHGYVLPYELRAAGVAFRRRRIAGRATYNGRLVGLASNLGTGDVVPSTWTFTQARYWDHLASDILATKDVLVDGRERRDLGRSLFVDRLGRVRDTGDSWLLNGVGTSVVAITTDGRVVATVQSDRNESSGGLLAPSGSGSLEPRDFAESPDETVASVAAQGALRELAEEAAVRPEEVVATACIGYARWLEKAAKPELLTVALLSIDSHEVLRRRVPSPDRPYTLALATVRLEVAPAQADPDRVGTLVAPDTARRLSLPLELGLRMLCRAAREAGSPVARLLAGIPE